MELSLARGDRVMDVLAIATQKGGTGKTTVSVNLAVAAAEVGRRVAALDLDPQASLAGWAARREADDPAVDHLGLERIGQLPKIFAALERQGYDLVVLDSAGALNPTAYFALRAASLVLIPARPTLLDLLATEPTLRALAEIGLADRVALLLNQCPTQGQARAATYAERLRRWGHLAEPPLTQRVDYQDALLGGQGVTEFAPAGKAAGEIRALWAWIEQRLKESCP